ncbi:MAG: chromate efflux transporter [Deltaproteobacteria bacterium]|nr:MAG: chromate efflux transporter [Deltaproteobacteria bacterium]
MTGALTAAPPTAAPPTAAPPAAAAQTRLRELAWLFARLGCTAFGGPAAHIAMMEDEVVRRRGWMTRERLLDLIGAANLIPGPTSTELAIHIGHDRAGWAGLVVAGACFILPAVAIVLAIAWVYVRFGALPALGGVLYGIKPVIIAVVVQALWGLGRSAIKSLALGAVGAVALAASLVGVDELIVLGAAGAVVALGRGVAGARRAPAAGWLPVPLLATGAAGAAGAAGAVTTGVALGPLFWVFLKIGSVLFGSGYVLLAFLRSDLVERLHWLTEAQLLDAVAVGQVTPGPVFTTATFIGYVLGGGGGAAVATLGIFLPAFAFVAISGPLVPRIRRSPVAGAFLDGVNAASLAIMAAVAIQLGRAAIVDVPTAVLAAIAAALLIRYRLNSAWLVLGGALVGTALALAA